MRRLGASRAWPFSVVGLARCLARRAILAPILASFLCACGAGAAARETVAFPAPYPTGTIVIKEAERKLYLVTGPGTAIRYEVAVGKPGYEWYGEAYVAGKYLEPAWTPPSVVRENHPSMPDRISGGSPRNPMGAAAIMLNRDDIAIHGTTRKMRRSVGTAASYGCFRMYNEDILDLFRRVRVGTKVIAVP